MFVTAFDSFARPANTTAYTSGDLVADNTTAGSVTPLQFSTAQTTGRGIIRSVLLFKDTETVTDANFNLHLFSDAPTVSNGDNGAFAVTSTADYLGTVALDTTSGGLASTTDVAKRFTITEGIPFDLRHVASNERRLYGLLAAAAGYAPGSGETFKVTLGIEA